MPAVGPLLGLGCAGAGGLSRRPGTIAAEHFNTGRMFQASGHGVGGAIGQKSKDPMLLQVHQDRAILLSALVRPVGKAD